MVRKLAVVLAVALLAGLAAAQESRTGTEPGQVLPGPFRVYVVTGQPRRPAPEGVQSEERQNLGDVGRIGKFSDFVTRNGIDPTVAVFSREIPTPDQPLAKLLQALDQAVERNRAARLHAFGIFLTLKGEYFEDESWAAQVKQIEALAQQLQLKDVPLAFDKAESERTRAYGITPETQVLVLVYVSQTVQARFAFGPNNPLDANAIPKIMDAVNKMLAAQK
jgi:hypothetical protein